MSLFKPIYLINKYFFFACAWFALVFPVRVICHKLDQTLKVSLVDLTDAPMEHLHDRAFQIERPITAVIYFLDDGFGVGFALTDALALVNTA